MATEVPFPGFHYDSHHAEAIAQALLEVLAVVRREDVPAIDQLAGLGIAAAAVIRQSKLHRNPQAFVAAYVAYLVGVLASRMAQEPPGTGRA